MQKNDRKNKNRKNENSYCIYFDPIHLSCFFSADRQSGKTYKLLWKGIFYIKPDLLRDQKKGNGIKGTIFA